MAEPSDSVPDAALRELARQAIRRAEELRWPVFMAIRHRPQALYCASASLPELIATFLRSSAELCFPAPPVRARARRAKAPIGPYEEITDEKLRPLLERAVLRTMELNWLCSINVRLPSDTPKNTSCSVFGYAPAATVAHMQLAFRVALLAVFGAHAIENSGDTGRSDSWRYVN